MGLDFGVSAPIPSVKGKRLTRAALFQLIREGVERSCDDPFMARFISFGEQEHELAVALHPEAEAVFFSFDPAGIIAASAKTSTTDPGYHAYAVEVVRAAGRHAGIDWDWSDDETGFATSGDFADLQNKMAEFLGFLGASFTEHHKGGTMAVTMGMGYPIPVNGPFTITPMGPRDRAFWMGLRGSKDNTAAAREYFVWWDRDRNAAYYRKLGLMLLWTQVQWHPPADEAERQTAELALECFERAAELDPGAAIAAPVASSLDELRSLLEHNEDDPSPIPDPDGIGYLRQVAMRGLPGDWRVTLPSYWYESFEEETATLTIGYNERAVHVTGYELTPAEGRPAPNAEQVCRMHDKHRPKGSAAISHREGMLHSLAWVCPHEEDGQRGFALQGTAAVPGEALDITVWFEDPAHEPWAIETFKSLSHPGAGGPRQR